VLPLNFRRSLSLILPFVNIAFFLGLLNSTIKLNDNIASTGLTPAIILAILNLGLWLLIYKHQVP
jgi:hypothetical protein